MLRQAFLRTAASAGRRAAIRTAPRIAAPASTSRFSIPAILRQPRVTSIAAVRCYSAAAGLKKDEVEGRIMELLKGFDKVNDTQNIKPTAHFANDLGLDSLDTVEVVMAIEEEFSIEIPDKDADAIHSVDKAVEYILSQPDAH